MPTDLTGVIAISAGENHIVALKSNGTVVAWGDDTFQQTAVPTGLTEVIAIAAGANHSVALKSEGKVVAWGDNTHGQTTVPNEALTEVISIAAGAGHTVALKSDGSVVAWGENTYGQTSVPYQGITFNPPTSMTFGDPAFDLSAYASGGASGNPVTFTVTSGPGTLNGSILTIAGAGNIVITASQAGNGNYFSASDVQATIIVAKATAAIILWNLNLTYDGSPKSATTATNPAGLAANFTYNGDSIPPTNVGSYAVVATINDANYQGTAGGTLNIGKANQTINFNPPGTALKKDVIHLIDFATGGTSGNPVAFAVTSGPGVIVGTDLTFNGTGEVVVSASQLGNSNYNAAANVQALPIVVTTHY